MRRPLSNPKYQIDHDGTVWSVASKPARKIPHGTHTNRFGTVHLTVELEGRRHLIWLLLGSVIYDGAVVLPRDGNFLNLRMTNVIALKLISSGTITDPDEIHLIWRLYCAGVICGLMADRSGLGRYSVEDFKSIIKDVMWASIR